LRLAHALERMMFFITAGAALGLSAGFSPGPLLTLVLTETLHHGVKAGIRVALAPMITDAPIIVLTLFVLSKLTGFHGILGLVSLAGGAFISVMAWRSMRTRALEPELEAAESRPLTKGVLANALNPHPYLFWFSVGAPLMTKALGLHVWALLAFLLSFYTFLVGSKVLLAVAVGRSKSILRGRAYLYTMRSLASSWGYWHVCSSTMVSGF